MAEEPYPRINLSLKVLAPIITVAGILIGVRQFQATDANTRDRDREQARRTDELNYRRALWEKRRDTYANIGDVVGQLAASLDEPKSFDAAVRKFDALYWGGMVLVEDAPVATAMKRLHEEIVDLRAERSSKERIQQRAYAVGEACRESLQRYQPEGDAGVP